MITLGLVVAAAAVALGVAKLARIPASVPAIVAGAALNAGSAPVEAEIVRDGLLLSATFLVFAVGAEIERRPLAAYRRIAVGIVAVVLAATAGVGALLSTALAVDAWTAVYWVVALGASSTLLVFEVLRRRERFFEPVGRTVTSAALLQDVVVILALSGFAASAGGGARSLETVAGVGGLAVGGWLLARWIAPYVMMRLGLDDEERLLFVLLVLFSFTTVATWTGNPMVTGAYFAGLAVSRFPVGGLARGYLKSFSDFFTTIFYVMLGLVVAIPSAPEAVAELVFVVAILVARPFVLLPLVRRTGLTVRSAIEVVMLLAQAGELAVIVALVGIDLGHVDEGTLGLVASIVVVTTALAPWLSSDRVTWRLTHWYARRASSPLGHEPQGHILLLGCGETGMALLESLRAHSAPVVVVDDDPAVVESLRRRGIPVLRGDGADHAVLRDARADRASAVVSTIRRPEDNARLLSMVQGPEVLVRVFSDREAQQVRRLGGRPVVEAEVAADAVMSWLPPASHDGSPGARSPTEVARDG